MKTKFGIVGCGFLGNIVADAWKNGLLEDYELVGVTSRTPASSEKTASNVGCKACADVEELLALEPEYIVETASVEAVRAMAIPVLRRESPCDHFHWCLCGSGFLRTGAAGRPGGGQNHIWPAVPSAALMCCRPLP